MGRVALVASLAGLAACAAALQPVALDQAALDAARRNEMACAARHMPDADITASAVTVAQALSAACQAEYDATTAILAAPLEIPQQQRDFRQRRASSAERTEAFVPYVVALRRPPAKWGDY